MKNVIITILTILVLCLGGYLVYDKVIDNKNLEEKKEIKEENKEIKEENKESVGVAFSNSLTHPFPTDPLMGKDEHDPDTITKKVVIPKILIETSVTQTINDKIYNDHKAAISVFDKDYSTEDDYEDLDVNYDYKIYDNILFIFVRTVAGNHRAGGYEENDIYYYDIKNDKELTVEEVCNKYNISLYTIVEASAEKIYGIMPTYLNKFDIYYTQKKVNFSCPSVGCMDVYSTFR